MSMSRGSRGHESEYGREVRRPRVIESSLLDARVYIGGLNVKNYSYREIESWMDKYGKVLDLNFCDRHILVQFEREDDATRAVDREKGQNYRGARFDIRFAHSADGSMGRLATAVSRSPRNISRERDSQDLSPVRRDSIRERSPEDKERYYQDRRAISPDDRNYEQSRSNNRPEVVNDDNNAMTLSNKVPPERPSFDAAIVVMSSDLLNYAETIESKFQRQMSLKIHIIVLKEESHANACVEDLEKKGVLYAFLINHLNEKHMSCTLRILHGTGQEHRNMILSNALTFVERNFEEYQKLHRELKAMPPKSTYDPSRMPPGFVAPDDKIIYQLHLLADSRMLTMDELNEVDDFIQKRLQVLAQAEGAVDKSNAMIIDSMQNAVPSKSLLPIGTYNRDGGAPMTAHGQFHSNVMIGAPQSQLLSTGGIDNSSSLISDQFNNTQPTIVNKLQNPKVLQALDSLMQTKFRPNLSSSMPSLEVIDDGGNYLAGGVAASQYYGANMIRPGVAQQRQGIPMYGPGYYQQPQLVTPQAAVAAQAMYRPRPQFQVRPNYPGY